MELKGASFDVHGAVHGIDLLVLRVLPSAVKCIEIGRGPVTLRRKLPCVVPGQRLTVNVERRWTWRHTVRW